MFDPQHLGHNTYRAINRPLTIWGVERRLFFVALAAGGGVFNAAQSLVAGGLVWASLYGLFLWTARTDPQFLRMLLAASRCRRRYDPAKPGAMRLALDAARDDAA